MSALADHVGVVAREEGRLVLMLGRAVATGLLGSNEHVAMLRLLPMSDRDKDTEILALCQRRSA